jgi:hypothetical protein
LESALAIAKHGFKNVTQPESVGFHAFPVIEQRRRHSPAANLPLHAGVTSNSSFSFLAIERQKW